MKMCLGRLLGGIGVALGVCSMTVGAQSGSGTAETHIASAKLAAGRDHLFMFNTLCVDALAGIGAPPAAPTQAAAPSEPPPRSKWHAEPVKVFDNLYWLGTIEHSAWAITTSDGIILMDAIFDYTIEDEVIEGLKKVGLNPASIKYAIIGHAHGDHIGGAKALQDRYGTRIVLGKDDWDLLDRTGPGASSATTKPRRDILATDGMKVTLGDTTVTVYNTPGHTQGTLSSIFTVKDQGQPHVVAYWGGTMFNWIRNRAQYITPGKTDKYWFDTYASSAARFRDIATKAGAEVLLSNHTDYDHTKTNLPQLAARKPGSPNPYVVGTEGVQRYLTTIGECAQAGSLRVK